MTNSALRLLVVLYSAGLDYDQVSQFHERVAAADAFFRQAFSNPPALEIDLAQVDRPLRPWDFLLSGGGRLRLDPATVAEDLSQRRVDPGEYPIRIAYFHAGGRGSVYALSVERQRENVQVALAGEGPASIEHGLVHGLRHLVGENLLGDPDWPHPEAATTRDSLLSLLRKTPESAWSRFAAGRHGRDDAGLSPLYRRVVIPAGNRSLFLAFRGTGEADLRLKLGNQEALLAPRKVSGESYCGAWIDLPGGEFLEKATAGPRASTELETVRVGYVEAQWKENPGGPAVLEAEVREEALGGSLRLSRARITASAGRERFHLREFPGGRHVAERRQGPLEVIVSAELTGWRLRPARAGPGWADGAPEAEGRSPAGEWIQGEERQ